MLSLAQVAPSNLTSTLSLVSGLGCVTGIAQISKQQITRLAKHTSMGDVRMDVASALINIALTSSLIYCQLIYTSALGGVLEHQITKRVGSIGFPQVITGFY